MARMTRRAIVDAIGDPNLSIVRRSDHRYMFIYNDPQWYIDQYQSSTNVRVLSDTTLKQWLDRYKRCLEEYQIYLGHRIRAGILLYIDNLPRHISLNSFLSLKKVVWQEDVLRWVNGI